MKKPGSGHLFKRGKTYWLEYTVDGERFRQSLGTRDGEKAKGEANKILEPHRARSEVDRLSAIARKIQTAKDKAATSPTAATLANAWSLFLALDKERRPCPSAATLAQYESHWNTFTGWMEKNAPSAATLAAVKEDHAVRFIRHLNAQGLNDGTVNKYKRFLKMFFRVMAKPYGLGANPFDDIQTNKNVVQAAKQPFTVGELREIVERADGEMRTLYLLGAGLGLRLGDCCTLLWGEVDLARRMVNRVPHKTARRGVAVKIGIPATLTAHLSTLPRRGPYVLPGLAAEYEAGKAPNIAKRIQSHLEDCGILTIKPGTGGNTGKRAVVLKGFHSFRHSYVSLNADAGTSQSTMMALVGHGSPAMTMHYLTPTDRMVLQAADALPVLLDAEIVEPEREPLPGWAVEIVKNAKSLKALRAELLKK